MAKAHIALSTINQQTGKKQVAMKPNFQPFILNQYQKYQKRMVMVFNQQILDFD
jgi:ribosomal protein S30